MKLYAVWNNYGFGPWKVYDCEVTETKLLYKLPGAPSAFGCRSQLDKADKRIQFSGEDAINAKIAEFEESNQDYLDIIARNEKHIADLKELLK